MPGRDVPLVTAELAADGLGLAVELADLNLAGMASEEMEGIYVVPNRYPQGEYLLLFDPLDGSSNIDVNVSIGTIFSVHERRSPAQSAASAAANEKLPLPWPTSNRTPRA